MGTQCCGGVAGRRFQYVPDSPTGVRRFTERLADNWDVKANPMAKNNFGVWDVTVPAQDGAPAIPHDSKIKVKTIYKLVYIGPQS